MQFPQRLKDLREDKDLRQVDVARILNTEQTYYSKYERGIREMPIHHLITLCRFYNISADYVLGFTDTPLPLPKK